MSYTKPIRSKNKTKRVKRLTIGNTDRYKNYNSITNADIQQQIAINYKNIKTIKNKIEKQLASGTLDTKAVYRYDNVNLYSKLKEPDVIDIIDMGVNLIYHTSFGTLSDKLLDSLARSVGDTAVLYSIQSEYRPTVGEVQKAHSATKVTFDVSLVLPDMIVSDIVKAFEPYKTDIDEVQVDIPALTDKEINYGNDKKTNIVEFRKTFYTLKIDKLWHCSTQSKYTLYKGIERPFSTWGTYITMICEDNTEKKLLDKMVKDNK